MTREEKWMLAIATASWRCVDGDVDDACWWYFEPEPETCQHECGRCGWKFRDDSLWGCSWGDCCPNCLAPGHDIGDEQ